MSRRLRVVFMGTPAFAATSLELVAAHHDVVLVVSQPDKPTGRGGVVSSLPVAAWASARGVPLLQPRSMRAPEIAEALRATGADLAIVVAYGKLLPPAVLTAFPLGCINVHGSLLPRHRGAAPVQRAIIDGDEVTGVSIMQLDEGMDTGPVFATAQTTIDPRATAGQLMDHLAGLGAELLVTVLADLAGGTAVAVPQPADGVTMARMLEKRDGMIDFAGSARAVGARLRGVDPWPGAVCRRGETVLKVFGGWTSSRVAPGGVVPGQVLHIDAEGAHVACGEGVLVIAELQAAGRKRLTAAQVAAGRGLVVGDVLEPALTVADRA